MKIDTKQPRWDMQNAGTRSVVPLGSGTQEGTGVELIGQVITKAGHSLADASLTQAAKLRTLDINTKKNNNKSILTQASTQFMDSLHEQDQDNPDDWQKLYSDYMMNIYSGLADMSDDVLKKYLEVDFFQVHTAGISQLSSKINKVKVNNGLNQVNRDYTDYQSSVASAKTAKEIITQFETFKKRSLDPNKGLLFDQDDYKSKVETARAIATEQLMLLGAGSNIQMLSPTGSSEVNYKLVAKNLADPTFEVKDLKGKLISVHDPRRKGLIQKVRGYLKQQNDSHAQERIRLAEEVRTEVTQMFDGFSGMTTQERVQTREKAEDRVKNSHLPELQKEALLKYINDYTKEPSIYQYQQRETENKMIDMIRDGTLHSEEHRQVVDDLYNKNRISKEGWEKIKILFTQKADPEKTRLKKQALKFIASELDATGAYSRDMQSDNIAKNSVDENQKLGKIAELIYALSNRQGDDKVYLYAKDNLEQLLERGVKRGYTYKQMLSADPEYSIIDEVVKAAVGQDVKDDPIYIQQTTLGGEPIFIVNPEAKTLWNKGKYNINFRDDIVPQKVPGESVEEYLKRIGK